MLARILVALLVVFVVAVLLALVPVLRDPAAVRRRIESLFRRPDKRRTLEADHYYRPYWS